MGGVWGVEWVEPGDEIRTSLHLNAQSPLGQHRTFMFVREIDLFSYAITFLYRLDWFRELTLAGGRKDILLSKSLSRSLQV